MNPFETFLGIPLHPLAVHVPVVLVPMLILAALAYALVPRLRPQVGWVAVLLAIATPLSALAAKLSGDAFRARYARRGASADFLAKVDAHRSLATILVYVVAVFALAVLAMVLARNASRALTVVLAVVTVGLALASAYYVFRAGDTGAHVVWTGS